MSAVDLTVDDGDLIEGFDDELVDPLPVRVTRALAAEVLPGWSVGAPCASADDDAWFPDAVPADQVLRTCQACPLRRPCLAAGILRNEHGVWGGTSRVHRTRARRRLADDQPVSVVLDQLLDRDELSDHAGDAAGFGAAA